MARRCTMCDKSSQRAANRSHAKNKTLRRQKPNLQKFLGVPMCSSCRRTLTKYALNA